MTKARDSETGGARRLLRPAPACARTARAAAAAAILCLAPLAADAAWMRPLGLEGDFYGEADAVNIWRRDGKLDVAILFRVPNRELTFASGSPRATARVRAWAELRGPDGEIATREREYAFPVRAPADAAAVGLGQVFALILPDVPFRWGVLQVRVEDLGRGRSSLLDRIGGAEARSEAIGDWEAPAEARLAEGLQVGDPLFLALAPLALWRERDPAGEDLEQSELLGHLHPHRRYGIEQSELQLYFQVDPPLTGPAADAVHLQLTARDLEFSLRDTIAFDESRRASLAAGRPVGVFYQLDVNLLPAGTYQLGCVPADGRGRTWLAEFDVSWEMAVLNRPVDEVLGEGRIVMSGERLERFLEAGQVQRTVMLEEFWSELDPEPTTPQNEARLEFRRRLAHVRQNLGGFGAAGAPDPRGEVYLLLGPPDEVQDEAMPLNRRDLEDATVRVFETHDPERMGQTAKGDQRTGGFHSTDGPVPLSNTYRARREVEAHRHETGRDQAFELWIYEQTGRQLFTNRYSGQQLGLRFLFVDVAGTGKSWKLQSTNAAKLGTGE